MIKGIVGIECGSRNSVISKIGRHGLENIASEASNREIPCVVVYGDEQRYFAELAQDRLKAFWQKAVVYPFRLCANEEIAKGFTLFRTNPEQKKAIIDGQELELVQLVASYFTYLDNLIYKNLNEQDNYACAISTPNYFTLEEKMRLQMSAQIARLPCLKLVEEHCAIGYSYLWFQKKELHEKRRRVLFIDLGQSQTSCFIYDFDKLTARAEYVNSNRDLGVRNIDALVYQYLVSKYPGILNKINKKSELRVIDQLEKLRKVLSSNTEANFMIECLTADHDLQHNFTREEFEQILQNGGFVKSFEEILNRSVCFCLEQEIIIDDIEIIGGGTRIPFVQSLIKKFFGRDKLGITMQTSENISRGCAIACALAASQINPLIKIENYKLYNILQQDLAVELFVQGQKYAEQKFISTQFLPTFQQISAVLPAYMENMEIELRFNKTVYRNTEKISGNNVNVAYTIADNGLLSIKQASVVSQNVENQEQKMVDESQEQQQQQNPDKMETEQNEKYFDMDIVDIEYGEQIYKQMVETENQFRDRDDKVLLKQEKRNYLENYVNESLRFLNEHLRLHFTMERLNGVYQILRENKEYIDNNSDIEISDTDQRIQLIKNVYEPIKNEYLNKESSKLPIRTLDELKNISTAYSGKTIQDIQLLLSNQSIGDGGGLMGYFKSAGSIKVKEFLSAFGITRSLLLELGNNTFSDVGIKNILKGLSAKSLGLKEFSINLESNLKANNKNTITAKSINKVIKFVKKLNDIEILDICVNSIEQNELNTLEQVLVQKNKLKQVKLQIKNFEENKINRENFILHVQKTCGSVLVDCYNSTGMKVH